LTLVGLQKLETLSREQVIIVPIDLNPNLIMISGKSNIEDVEMDTL
jgi:hypothetical protein